MGKIFYIIGPSSSGKDTIFKNILKEKSLHLKTSVMYTTRPIRKGETEGVEYHFVKESELNKIKEEGRLIELREYETVHGKWNYFTVKDDQIDLSKDDYLMIGVLDSFVKTRDYFGTDKVIPILVELDDGERLLRALNRERMQEKPRYQEMCRRYLADAQDFSDERKKEAGLEIGFYNNDLEQCLQEIIDYIRKQQETNN